MESNADDDILTLMDQMRQQQGYQAETTEHQTSHYKGSSKRISRKNEFTTVPTAQKSSGPAVLAGNHTIWNPHVHPATIPGYLPNRQTSSISYSIPTNPQVEVIRRRAFEKFKQECSELLIGIQKTLGIKLPIPSMLEKWHMDAKLIEQQQILKLLSDKKKEQKQQQPSPEQPPQQHLLIASTAYIHQQYCHQRAQKYFHDPILLSRQSAALFLPILEMEVQKAYAKISSNTTNNNNKSTPSKNKNSNKEKTQHHHQTQGGRASLPPNFTKKTKHVQKAIYKFICQAQEMFLQQLLQARNQQQQQQQSSKKKLPKIVANFETSQYQITFAGITLKVHTAYYEKLQILFQQQQQQQPSPPATTTTTAIPHDAQQIFETTFEESLFCVLCRYDMLQGAGLQAAVPGKVMDVLLERLDCQMECFASPLNCRYNRFASAFHVDCAFGSLGSFFDLSFSNTTSSDNGGGFGGGCYQANPPFCEGLIDQLDKRIRELLLLQHSTDLTEGQSPPPSPSLIELPLMFVVIVPAWKECKAYQEGLLRNEFLTEHLLLPQSKHWYAEGTQHRRKGSFRVASFDTSVLFYQNSAAKQKWPVNKNLLDAIEKAFCEDPGTMEKTLSITAPLKEEMEIGNNVDTSKGTDKEVDDAVQSTKSKSSTQKRKRKETNTKRKGKRLALNPGDEDKAQLKLLESLGIANVEPQLGTVEPGSSSKRKKSSKGKQR